MSQKSAKQNRRVQELEALLQQSEQEKAELLEEVKRLRQKMDRLTEQFLNAQRAQFGQSSEKKIYVMGDSDQLQLFNEAETAQDPKAKEPTVEEVTVAAHKRKKKRSYEELTEGLPEEEILLELHGDQLICSKCGGTLKLIGKKFVKSEIIYIPAQVKLLKYFACTYACDQCEKKTGFANIVGTVAPPSLMKHSLASPSSVAEVMTKKYVDGVPLTRQEKIWKREGIELSNATLANWVIQPSQTWLKPLYRRMKKALLESPVIHADETVVQVLKEDGKKASSQSRMWVYVSPERCDKPIRYFEYQPDRKGIRAAEFLRGFHGCLVTDGYTGYDQVDGVTRCGCWAHMRRKWREAMPKGATMQTSQAAVGYNYCNKLFALEKKFAKMSEQNRKFARQAEAEPLLDAYWLWLKTLEPVPGSKLEEAVTYANNQREYLCAFLKHGEVEISNNPAENAIRPFVVGRKNWLFSDTPKGADSSAIVYTLVETAKANGVDPYAYLLRVLSLLPYLGKNPSNAELDELLPWHPRMQASLRRDDNLI